MILECTHCQFNFEGEILHDYEIVNSDDWLEAVKYTLSKCPRCETPVLVEQDRAADMDDSQQVFVYWDSPKLLYPQTDFHINPVIPEILRASLIESVQCYRAKSYTATAIMCRRTIEGFCSIKGIKGTNLAQSIIKMKQEGIINEQLFEWANELRLVGNEAAHDIDVSFGATDSRDILDFTIAILDFTYSFKDKFEKFKERMASKRQRIKK